MDKSVGPTGLILEGPGPGPDLGRRKGLRGVCTRRQNPDITGKNVGLPGGQVGPEERQGWSMEQRPGKAEELSLI